jgi:receptor expression-enhancing protein 5/6
MSQAQAQAQQTKNQILNHPLVQQVQQVVNGQINQLDKNLSSYPALNDLEAKTKVPKAYAALGLGASFILLIFFNFFGLASPISNLVGWVLPAYWSCLALESPSPADDIHWLTYWVIFGLLNFLESAGLRLILYYIPYYFVMKTVFTLWLMSPQFRGGEVMYRNFVQKAFRTITSTAKSSSYRGPASSSSPVGYATTSTSFEHDKSL